MPLTSRSVPLPFCSALPAIRMAPDRLTHRRGFTEGRRAHHCWHAGTGEDQEFAAPRSPALGALRDRRPDYRGLYQSQGRARAEIEPREIFTRNEAHHRARLASEKIRRRTAARQPWALWLCAGSFIHVPDVQEQLPLAIFPLPDDRIFERFVLRVGALGAENSGADLSRRIRPERLHVERRQLDVALVLHR